MATVLALRESIKWLGIQIICPIHLNLLFWILFLPLLVLNISIFLSCFFVLLKIALKNLISMAWILLSSFCSIHFYSYFSDIHTFLLLFPCDITVLPHSNFQNFLVILLCIQKMGKLLPKNEEISRGKIHANKRKLKFRWSQMSFSFTKNF